MSPQELQRAALMGVLDIAIHFEEINWTASWTCVKAADLKWKLFARSQHPLREKATLSEVLKFPFVGPGHWTGEKLVTGDDGFPIPWRNRIKGYEVQTALNGLRLVRSTNQLVFLPSLLANEFLIEGEVRPIEITDMQEISRPIYVSIQNEKINQKQLISLVAAVKTMAGNELLNKLTKKQLRQELRELS